VKRHEHLDSKILKAINTLSPTSFVSAIEVNDRVKMDKKEFGDHLMALKKSGQVDITSRDSYPV
jgi:RIO-like serine/threonine protein kinase